MSQRPLPTRGRRRLIAGTITTAAGIAIAIPAIGATTASTSKVAVGGPVPHHHSAETQAYYPRVITIHAGDKVRFNVGGFHTVTFVPKGKKLPGVLAPTGQNAAPANDPAGTPYWWGAAGVPQFSFNAAAAAPSKHLVVTGKTIVNSGFPAGRTFTPTFTFPKPGTYVYYCTVHPGMKGIVKVLPATATLPSAASQTAAGAAQLKADQAALVAKVKTVTTNPAPNTVSVGIGTARGHDYVFAPSNLTVAAGTTVTFNWVGRTEIHTVTFGPKAERDRLLKAFGGTSPVVAAEAQYPSDPPGTPVVVTPTSHGDGLVNSGVVFDPGEPTRPPGAPTSWQVTFTTPGVYTFQCMIHDTMVGTITVTP